jgi:uncharacterized protein with LGFP repeats
LRRAVHRRGKAQDFRGGSIYWSPDTGAHAVHGAILTHYKELGGPGRVLGYPTTDERTTLDAIGRYNHFTGGDGASIYWTPGTGAWSTHGTIRAKWAALGWERSHLGYPTSNEYAIPGDRANNYQDGTIQFYYGSGVRVIYR